MDAFELLTTRSSTPRLQAPAPAGEDWQLIQKAAMRTPDHGGLKPWSFIVFNNEAALLKLGDFFAQAVQAANPDAQEAAIEKARGKSLRAPMVIACIAKVQEHPKVPKVEQVIAAGCAVMAMQQAAFALGFGGVWRTGANAYNPLMKTLLGLEAQDEIVGYLYLGTAQTSIAIKSEKDVEPHFVEFKP
ncbi:MAG: nitroreductase [Phenylobacterium sp.]|jgi:nitroreductase